MFTLNGQIVGTDGLPWQSLSQVGLQTTISCAFSVCVCVCECELLCQVFYTRRRPLCFIECIEHILFIL